MKEGLNEVNYISERIKTGAYFEDGKDWFYNKYVSPYKEKINYIVLILIIAIIIILFIFSSITSVLNVKPSNGVTTLAEEFESHYTMEKIKNYYNNNEKNILRFVAEKYVLFFESYNTDRFNIYNLQHNINVIKANSNKNVGEKFERIVQNNYTTEVFSGITRVAKINEIEYITENKNAVDSYLNYILPEKTPRKMRFYITSYVYQNDGKTLIKEEPRTIEITFSFKKIKRNKEGHFEDIDFKVTSYNYI